VSEGEVLTYPCTMTFTINGLARVIDDATTVADVVAVLGLPAATLLVEHNGTALRRIEWNETKVRDGDAFEVMQISAGG
jgi:sulfur carrier protein